MAKEIYTAQARVVGGRAEGHGVTSDGNLDVQLRRPTEMGGDGSGTNPEQLFAVGYAACFEGALQAVARRQKVDTGKVAIDSRVGLRPTADRAFELTVGLDVTLPDIASTDEAVALVKAAHAVCPYSNATRGNVDVMLTANGQAVD
jgi:osmotically inducible protein OsmC